MIIPAPNAPEGSVKSLSAYSPQDFNPISDVVLCRFNAPIIKFAFQCLNHLIPVQVNGKDFGEGLKKVLQRLKGYEQEELRHSLATFRQKEVSKLLDKSKKFAAANLEDKCQCLAIIIRRSKDLDEVQRHLDDLFENAPGRLLLSTIHRAKGREWTKVFILDPHLMPSRYATLPWERIQERNLQYVAVTRAKLDLVKIKSDSWE